MGAERGPAPRTRAAGVELRRGRAGDGPLVAPLILEAAPSISLVLSPSRALLAAEKAFRADDSMFGYPFSLVAEDGGVPVGLALAYRGGLHRTLQAGAMRAMARAGGAGGLLGVLRREVALLRLTPAPGEGRLYLSALAVDPSHRGRGVGTGLLERVVAGARRLGLGVATDVEVENEPGRRLYERLGFRPVAVRRTTIGQQRIIPTEGMVRMELGPG